MNPIQERPVHYPYFLRPDYLKGSAHEGTIRTKAGDRVIALPEELIQGLHRAIAFETGRALPVITYTCGRRWGARVVRRWEEAWRQSYQERMEASEYPIFENWLVQAFRFHGWGELEIDFSMEDTGIVQFFLKDCVLAKLLADIEEPMVGDIFAGLFASLTSWIVGRELECAQVACEKNGAERCHFVVALPDRIERVRDVRLDGGTTERMLARLME